MVQNDHNLLEMIQQKPIHMAPPISADASAVQKYNYTIQYKPSKEMVLADHLSCFPSCSNSISIPIVQNVQHVQLPYAELDVIRGSIECDLVYSTLFHLTLRGWHKHRQQVPRIARHFWGTWNELSINTSLLLKGTRVCISPELLNCTLADLHGMHQGINRMQTQVREAVYQLGIDADITDYVCHCTICTKCKAFPPTQPRLPRDIPNGPWQEITSNYLTHRGRGYLLVCNLFSKYPFLYKVSTKSAQSPCPPASSSCNKDHLVCSIPTMGHPLYLKNLHSSCSATTLTM